MTSLLKVTIMFLLAVYAQATDDPTDDDFGMVKTGPPSHGDYVICWADNVQTVLSGGLCKTNKIGSGKSSWGLVNSKDVKNFYISLLEMRNPVECEKFYDQYYLVGVVGGCMVSTSNISAIEVLKPIMIGSWTVVDENSNQFVSSACNNASPSLWITVLAVGLLDIFGLINIENIC